MTTENRTQMGICWRCDVAFSLAHAALDTKRRSGAWLVCPSCGNLNSPEGAKARFEAQETATPKVQRKDG